MILDPRFLREYKAYKGREMEGNWGWTVDWGAGRIK
jgi:hypothetical protein